MGQKIEIIESTLRDGQQSLWATRMTTPMMLPILPAMDGMGFNTIEFMGTAVMDASVRYLKENPWERMRLVRQRAPRTPLGMVSITLGFSVGKGALPDDVSELFFTRCVRNGVDRYFLVDGLNDTRNFTVPVRAVRAAGAQVFGAITYSVSPVHTDEHFVARTRELVAMAVDVIVLKDPNGLLTPERVRTLVPAMCQAAGDRPVYCHSHCVIGLGPAANLEAVSCGATGIWTCAAPLANGASLPATESMARHLIRMGYTVDVDVDGLPRISDHILSVARRHGKPLGEPAEYDPSCFDHQMPGGMISNFRSQLAQLGIQDRLDEVLDTIPQVREDLGWSLMVTPFSQMIGIQAALNVLYGPYKVILDEVKNLALGHYGRTPAPVKPNVLDRIGGGKEPIQERPASLVPPALERFRREQGPFASDDDLLLNYFFMPDQLRQLREAGPLPTEEPPSLADLVRQAARLPGGRRLHLVQGQPVAG